MPISCPGGEKPRYRVTKKGGKNIRLGYCGNKVVESKVLKTNKTKK